MQAQFIETMLLLTINHQSLIATKASRMVRAVEGRTVLRVRLSPGNRVLTAQCLVPCAAYIGGCAGTACVLCDRDYLRAGRRHHGPQLGADVRVRIRRLRAPTLDLIRGDCTLLYRHL